MNPVHLSKPELALRLLLNARRASAHDGVMRSKMEKKYHEGAIVHAHSLLSSTLIDNAQTFDIGDYTVVVTKKVRSNTTTQGDAA